VDRPVDALLLDAGGALLHPAEPVARTYARVAARHGGTRSEAEVAAAFGAAFGQPWAGPRYVGDGRPFWRVIVAAATGVDDDACFEALYTGFEDPAAWRVAPGARSALRTWRAAGGRAAVVSNWDTRLGPLLDRLGLSPLLDARFVSAEVGLEKPDPALFACAVVALGVPAARALHLGDSESKDVAPARAAGLEARLWTGDNPPLDRIVHDLLRGGLPR
jgi:REG-2-like HAD superfamily hydrolase